MPFGSKDFLEIVISKATNIELIYSELQEICSVRQIVNYIVSIYKQTLVNLLL